MKENFFIDESTGFVTDRLGLQYLPSDMSPDKDTFIELGFNFSDSIDNLYLADIPDGWSIKYVGNHWSYLYDANNNFRAKMFYYITQTRPFAFLTLNTYYSIDLNTVDELTGIMVIDSKKNVIRAISGTLKDDLKTLFKEARSFLDENYPDWRNPLSYWD